jgi:FkbM family methyltransferase
VTTAPALAAVRDRWSRAKGVVALTWGHPANAGRRLQAVARVVSFQVRGRLRGVRAIAPLGDHSRIWADAHVYISARAMYANPLDWNEMQAWRRHLGPGDLFVDVGANVGLYTVWALDGGAEVIAIEPSPRSLALLEENLLLNGYCAQVVAAAAGAAPGTMAITSGLDQQNHLVVGAAPVSGDSEMVAVETLDAIVGDRVVAGLKIDVEGAEALVLAGAGRLLADKRVRLMQLEWNEASVDLLGQDREPLRRLLAGYGYELFRPDRHGDLVPTDGSGFGADIFARPIPEP